MTKPGPKPRPLADRLWEKVEKRGPDECWPWRGVVSRWGHGRISIARSVSKFTGAHRVAYELAKGPIPAGMFVCHHCDNPPCCNPAHLFVGTPADNSADMAAKRRCRSGEAHPMAVLAAQDVREIWAMLGQVPVSRIAERYGVNPATIGKIARRERWAHVTAAIK